MTELPFYKRVRRVTVKGQELTTDQTNPYINQNWFQANQESEKKMPTGTSNVSVKERDIARRRKQLIEMTRRQPMKQSEIERAFGYSSGGSWSMLQNLKNEGKLTRINGYWLPPTQGRVAIPQGPIAIPERPTVEPVNRAYTDAQPVVRPEVRPEVEPKPQPVWPPMEKPTTEKPSEKPSNEAVLIDKIEKLAKDFVWEADGPHTLRDFIAWMRQQ